MNSQDQIEKEVEELIKKCHWRKEVHGVDICTGAVAPCMHEIDQGRCDTLRTYFDKLRKEDEEK